MKRSKTLPKKKKSNRRKKKLSKQISGEVAEGSRF